MERKRNRWLIILKKYIWCFLNSKLQKRMNRWCEWRCSCRGFEWPGRGIVVFDFAGIMSSSLFPAPYSLTVTCTLKLIAHSSWWRGIKAWAGTREGLLLFWLFPTQMQTHCPLPGFIFTTGQRKHRRPSPSHWGIRIIISELQISKKKTFEAKWVSLLCRWVI